MTTVDELNRDKTKVPDFFFFRNVSLVCFTAELDELTDSQSMYVFTSLSLKLYGYIPVCKGTIAALSFCFNPLFSVVQLGNYTKTIIPLRLSEYCRIIIRQYSLRLRQIIVKYKVQPEY